MAKYDGHLRQVVQVVPPSQRTYPLVPRHAPNLRAAFPNPVHIHQLLAQQRFSCQYQAVSGTHASFSLAVKQGWRLLIPNRSCNFRPTPAAVPALPIARGGGYHIVPCSVIGLACPHVFMSPPSRKW